VNRTTPITASVGYVGTGSRLTTRRTGAVRAHHTELEPHKGPCPAGLCAC
jgi:hypothetical protein